MALKNLILLISCLLIFELRAVQYKDLPDVQAKGIKAWFELANLTNHIPFSYEMFPKRSDDVMAQLKIFESIKSYIAATGVASVFPEQVDDRTQFYSMNNVDKTVFILRDYQNVIKSILGQQNQQCSDNFSQSSSLIINQFRSLYKYTRAKKGIDSGVDVLTLASNVTQPCDNRACEQALIQLVNGMIGSTSDNTPCDLMFSLNNYQQNGVSILGYRDLITSSNAYLITLMSMAISVQSAYRIIKSSDPSQWQIVQNQYGQQFDTALQRVKQIDKQVQANYLENAKLVVNALLIAQNNLSRDDMFQQIISNLTTYYQDYQWIVKSLDNNDMTEKGSGNYYDCKSCFIINDAFRSQYVFVAATSGDAQSNQDYLNQLDWVNIVGSMNSIVAAVNLYNGYCLNGVHAADKKANNSFYSQFPGYITIQTTLTIVHIWSVKQECLSQKQQESNMREIIQ
ncbi:UNKNOWN [Stylonychia lemnae]|uniref:Transmembrane protein n=1 Tax=Stylonychia lemnae TaxID=5949 RepID=A0A078AXK3_STYLE|nr:UNKNOWN [Stylonychia lemnae]|eukprot:CDW85528.1 UNKNOWN [Stylonychia lemnae]